MTSGLYDQARQDFLEGDLDWLVQDFRVILIDADDYAVDLAVDVFLDDIPAAARVAISGALAGKSSTAGVADANDLTLSAVSGDQCEALVIYQHTGVDATAQLIAYIDVATGFPITPNGGDIDIAWDSGANKIFKL